MTEKKILIFNAGPLFPVKGMNTVRIFNQIKWLSKHHSVDFMFLYTRQKEKDQTIEKLAAYCGRTIPLKTFTQGIGYRGLRKAFLKSLSSRLCYPLSYFSNSNIITSRIIAAKIARVRYDAVISHYWEASGFLKRMPEDTLRCIDTHYLVEENLDLYHKGMYGHLDDGRLYRLLEKELSLQHSCFRHTDLLIVNSQAQKDILEKQGLRDVLCVPNGQDLGPYLEYRNECPDKRNNLLFYGALSNQFNQKALVRILNNIWPAIKERLPEAKLIIMGSLPPAWLKSASEKDPSLIVTGFVDDVRTVFCRCAACLLPLESGSGFRGRTVELLASGVPVIGTTNALQSVQITHEVDGIIADTDEQLTEWTLKMMTDETFRKKISDAGKNFANTHYSLEATFGKLSAFFEN